MKSSLVGGGALALVAALVACGGPRIDRVKPQLQPPESPVDFGTLPVLNEKQIEVPVLNVGRATLTVTNVALGSADGLFRIVSAPSEVQSGNTEHIVVAFAPKEEKASANTLTFETNDDTYPTVTLDLKGVGSTRAVATIDPKTLNFGRVPECTSAVLQLTIQSSGTADLLIQNIAFSPDTPAAFAFVGSTKTPATVKMGSLITLTLRLTVAAQTTGPLNGAVLLTTTDPDQPTITVPISATINRAPVASIVGLTGNAAPGQTVTLDGSASNDPDADGPLVYSWTLRSKPLSSTTTILAPATPSTSMTLDIPGAYDVQLDVTDATGVKACAPARTTVVAAPAQKVLVELFWDNSGTDLDLHVLRNANATIGAAPDDCFYQDRAPDWGVLGNHDDDPLFVRDALIGYGPEVWGYVNPIDSTFRVAVVFNNELLSKTPTSTATVRVYFYGVLAFETSKALLKKGDVWQVADVTWPAREVKAVP